MKFTIEGREYEDYQLSNEDLYYLVSGEKYTYALTDEEREVLTKKLVERFKYDLCAKGGETRDDVFARFFSNYVNRCPNDFKRAAKAMGREHRYLQNEMFKVFMEYVKVLANNASNGCYDPRNQWACNTAKQIVSALEKANWAF